MANESRIGELLVELVGSKLSADFLAEVWQFASPEKRRALADEALARAVEKLSDWDIEQAIKDELLNAIKPAIATRIEAMQPKIEKYIVEVCEEQWKVMADRVIAEAWGEVRRRVASKLHIGG